MNKAGAVDFSQVESVVTFFRTIVAVPEPAGAGLIVVLASALLLRAGRDWRSRRCVADRPV